ncbi:NYN domain-containing protein [Rhodobacter sp. NSM]|uniref:NYN domain-containing protein n=1 Tax=Rhodobacter sp. NSM TaxID=3457501 RepID=UPI003FD50B59
MNVYVDGFNLYHSIDELGEDSLKWLCLRRLSQSIIGEHETLRSVKYFSAYATWHADAYARHRTYVQALEAEGVKFIAGQFKKKFCRCRICKAQYETHEEKETDVNIAIHLIRDTFEDSFDRAIVITADSDLTTAVNMARQIRGTKSIDVVAPPGRMGRARALKPLFQLSKGRIREARLNETYVTAGATITVPDKYRTPQP